MPGIERRQGGGKPYLTIKQGNLVQKVPEGTEGARCREGEVDGTSYKVHELVYMNWTGRVQGVVFESKVFGKREVEFCKIELEDAFISLNVDGRYFPDFAKKICGANLGEPVTLHPYDMEIDGDKKTGISMRQGEGDENKLKDHFWDGKKNLHGFPKADKDQVGKKGYWKMFFSEVSVFLVEEVSKLKFPEIKKDEIEDLPKSKQDKVIKSKEGVIKELEETEIPTDLPWNDIEPTK